MLFTLNSFDPSTDSLNHPRLIVVFNDVSKYGNDYDPLTVDRGQFEQVQNAEMSEKLRIYEYKTQLKEKAKKFHLRMEISDFTWFDNRSWSSLKDEVLSSEEYRLQKWYLDLTEYEKELLEDMKKVQQDIGIDQEIKQQQNPIKAK